MIALLLADLRDQRAVLVWSLLVVTVGAACGSGVILSMSTALTVAHLAPAPDAAEGLQVVGANIVLWTTLSAAAVIGATASLALGSRSREHALWVVLGVPRPRVRRVLLTQLVALGVLGGLLGFPIALAVADMALGQWASLGLAPADVTPQPAWWHLPVGIALGGIACLWGGWGATRRASRVPEMAALREAAAAPARVSRSKMVLSLCAGVLAVIILVVALTHPLKGPEDRAAVVLSANLCFVTALLLVGGWTLRPLLWAWTTLVPASDPAWFLARESCRVRSAQSITTVLPFALALSLLGVLVGGGNVLGGEVTLDEILILLGWVLLVAWVGGVAVIALVGRQRRTDTAVVAASGAGNGTLARMPLYEGVIYAVTAVLFGLFAMLCTIVTVAPAAGVPLSQALAAAPWGIFSGVSVLTTLTTCLTVAVPAHRAAATPPAASLRR